MSNEVCRMYFIRHGPTPWNDLNLIQSYTNVPLNGEGIAYAKYYARILKDKRIDAVVSSPLMRAWQTGLAIAGPRHLPVNIEYGLTERNFGPQLEGTDYRATRELRHKFLVDQKNNPLGIEDDERLRQRVVPAIENIVHGFLGLNVLVVSHSSLMRYIIKEFGGRTYEDMVDMPIDNGSMIKVFSREGVISASSKPLTISP